MSPPEKKAKTPPRKTAAPPAKSTGEYDSINTAPPPKSPPAPEAEEVTGEVVMTTHEQQRAAGILGGTKGFKLTEERLKKITDLVRMGNYLSVAAAATGIGENTLHRYLGRGRDVELKVIDAFGEDYAEEDANETMTDSPIATALANEWTCWRLWKAVSKAEAEAEAYAVGIVKTAMPKNWAAAMTFLERKAAKRWRRKDQHEIIAGEQAEPEDDSGLLGIEASGHVHDAIRAARDQAALPKGDDET